MITIKNIDLSEPYKRFTLIYEKALSHEKHIDAICISSFNKDQNQVESRFVNLKYIFGNEWIFFTNYNSPKALEFEKNDQISAVFFWASTYTQIRMKAKISKSSNDFSDAHFKERDKSKNKIAIISEQSQKIESYDAMLDKYNNINSNQNFSERPVYWGGYSFTPYYFEFWEGHDFRINKREVFEINNDVWQHYFLQP